MKGPLRKSPKSERGRARSVSTFGKTVVLQKRGASAPPGMLSSKYGLHRPGSVPLPLANFIDYQFITLWYLIRSEYFFLYLLSEFTSW